ncbi:hypothetical protein GCM10010964_00860 [Caldovatus sediminis]|uniref:AsmA domain-containing protein n=1 Tax=Caldovatus sediminis TaxID=2041189 RepID=A0A8J2Z7A5_9PROT|nr:AsmA family protein [Caldovatus sediminis]GGG16395.1 hypothetical protein GCM10010964_00860 [Caldovatus sediminis]
MTRRLVLGLALLLAALGGALWLGPRFVDWEAQRPRLAAMAAVRLGRAVAIEGDLRLALLPQPRIEASRVRVGTAGDDIDVAARTMRLRLDLGALLAGRIEPREIALVGAEIRLPWPPATTLALRPPPWLLALDARIEEGRVRIGEAVLEDVAARLSAGGALEAVEVEGRFAFRGMPTRFAAVLGRPGYDGVSTLDLTLGAAGATATARGALLPEGGFEGRVEAAGEDLAALLPAPRGPFRGSGRLIARAELIAADEIVLDLAGVPARGAAALRLLPRPRLDIALAASRLDLDAWIAALRAAVGRPAMPTSLDLSAEAASFRGVALRRLRGAATLEDERLTLTDVSALLPGETIVELAGASAARRLELALHFQGANLRQTLLAFGVPLGGTDPSRPGAGEGRLRLVLEESQASIADLAATIDGARVSGAGVLRFAGPRPAIGAGLSFDRLALDGLVPEGLGWADLAAALGRLDANLRIAAEHVAWRGVAAERTTLDAALEGGRLVLRRLSGHVAGADLTVSGAVAPEGGNGNAGPTLRLSDFSLEATAANAAGIAALLPGDWPDRTRLAAQPLALRLSGGGPAEALALRGEAELGELRVEAAGTLNARAPRFAGTLALRHPGAPRFLAEGLGLGGVEWLGEGSLSLVASGLVAAPSGVAAEYLDLTLAGLRGRWHQFALALDRAAPRPKLTGRFLAERIVLPPLRWHGTEPLGLALLDRLDAELAVEAALVEIPGAPALEAVEARAVRLAAGRLEVEGLRARLGGGTVQGALAVRGGAAEPPAVSAALRLEGATIAGPLFGLPVLDLTAGHAEGELRVNGRGHSPAALLATLEGELRLAVRNGVMVGFDLGALVAASAEEAPEAAEEAVRRALGVSDGPGGGATAFERLEVAARLLDGRAVLEQARLGGEGGTAASASGAIDLARGALDLQIAARPAQAEAPDIGLRLSGNLADPRRLAETSAWARWRAERG